MPVRTCNSTDSITASACTSSAPIKRPRWNVRTPAPYTSNVDRCRCGESFCSTFFVQPPPVGSYGPTHYNVELDPEQGTLILDVVDGRIACVEVLYRDDI